MAFQPVPDCAEVGIIYFQDLQTIQNRLIFQYTGAYDQEAIDLLATAVDGTVAAEWLPIQSSGVTYAFTEVRGLTSIVDLAGLNSDGAGAGELAQPALPNNVTFAIKLLTGRTGRSGRGRLYWIGLAESQVTANTLIAGAAQTFADAVAAVRASALTVGWQLVVASRVQDGVTLPVAVTYPVTAIGFTDEVVDSQRRRLPGRGA